MNLFDVASILLNMQLNMHHRQHLSEPHVAMPDTINTSVLNLDNVNFITSQKVFRNICNTEVIRKQTCDNRYKV